ncbi:universal stress protein [Aerococcus agrisoli]|uniref:Universal stress protein n=1 Tax=Aerococcus agrisoli TaxID=2487350 RepID=A0A3N4GPE0_9LACT|nr:universal stress protein [Aerococcus agrisoli]RPA60490.1 universal stress protein [Aerococcus agrisoli]
MLDNIKQILVPVDDSEHSKEAFRNAVEIARRSGAKVDVLSVVADDYVFGDIRISESDKEKMKDRTLESLEKYVEYGLNRNFTDIRTFTAFGNPRREIAKIANEGDYQLVVIGATGKGAISRALVGSVAEYTVRLSQIPVLVIK